MSTLAFTPLTKPPQERKPSPWRGRGSAAVGPLLARLQMAARQALSLRAWHLSRSTLRTLIKLSACQRVRCQQEHICASSGSLLKDADGDGDGALGYWFLVGAVTLQRCCWRLRAAVHYPVLHYA